MKDGTVGAMVDRYRSVLAVRYDAMEARSITRAVFRELFGWDVAQLEDRREQPIGDTGAERLDAVLARLHQGEPLQYVMGEVRFLGLSLFVSPAALIPRPETEELVAAITGRGREFRHVLDVGTGTGCIALALKARWPMARVVGCDVSVEALDLARRNAERTGLGVIWDRLDILDPHAAPPVGLDLIVSNPPYIPQADAASMEAHVLEHEPHLALFVPDGDPLLFYRAIAVRGLESLLPGGEIWLEGHHGHASAVGALLSELGYREVEVLKDLSGHDRTIHGTR